MRASSACSYSCAVCSALQYAAAAGYGECMPFLLECGANINAQDQNGVTALSAATRHGHPGIVKFLISIGADIYVRDIRQAFLYGSALDSDACVVDMVDLCKQSRWGTWAWSSSPAASYVW